MREALRNGVKARLATWSSFVPGMARMIFPFLRYRCLYFLLACCLSQAALADQVIELSRAELLISAAEYPPDETGAWRSVGLTHRWQETDYAQGNNGWYRIQLHLQVLPDDMWAIHLPRFNMNAAVFLNGRFLGASGRFKEPMSRNWNYPLYVPVPPELWQPGGNVIHVRLGVYPFEGNLAPIRVGPAVVLEKDYQRQLFFQVEISQVLLPMTVAMALFMFGLWLKRPADKQYLWFSLSVLAWSVFSLNMFIRNPPMGPKAWEWLAHASLDWWVVLFSLFCFRFIGKYFPSRDALLLGYGVLASLVYAMADLPLFPRVTQWLHGGSLVIGLYVVGCMMRFAWLRRRARMKASRETMMAGGLLILLMLGIHDWVLQFKVFGAWGTAGFHLHHYFAPLIFLFIGWHLVGRFVTALNEAEMLNRELSLRITEAREEIEAHYQTIRRMERNRLLAQERERLSREIHDGISGNISNAIMLSELIARDCPRALLRIERLNDQLKSGLDEMRNLILTLEEEFSCVRDVAGHIVAKYEQTLAPLEIAFEASLNVSAEDGPLTQQQSLNLLRIFQEALNNIVKHAQARHVSFQLASRGEHIVFHLEDDGRGFHIADRSQGYGLRNMRRRAKEIGAELTINSSPGQGCIIELIIAQARDPSP